MTSPFDALDRAVDDLAWRFGEVESLLGAHGQGIEGAGGKLVFDEEAQWRKMESMVSDQRMKAIARLRLIEAAMGACPAHAETFRLAFVPFGRASKPVIEAFTVGRVVLLGLAMAAPVVLESFATSHSPSLVDWLDQQAKSPKSRPIFERMRRQAQERLLPALQAYDVEAGKVRDADKKARREAHDASIRAIEDEAAKSRPGRETASQRASRLVADTLRLYREAGVE